MAMENDINTVVPGVQGKPHMLLNVRMRKMMRQSLQAVLPEISGNKRHCCVNRYAAISSLFLILLIGITVITCFRHARVASA